MTEAETFLTAWHRRHAGTSALVFGGARGADGRDSYEQLAAVVPDGVDVLDLACGDGFLLAAIRDNAPNARLTGVDMSPDEVAAARGRLPTVRVVEARAQSLPFPDGSFDVVASHMALMLMDDVDVVVAEVRRVLRPGGTFAGTVGARGRPPWVDAVLRPLMETRRKLGIPPGPDLGDARCGEAAALAGLLQGFEGFASQAVEVGVEVPRAGLGAFLREAYYGQDEVPVDEATRVLAGIDLPDVVRWPFSMLQFSARRSQ